MKSLFDRCRTRFSFDDVGKLHCIESPKESLGLKDLNKVNEGNKQKDATAAKETMILYSPFESTSLNSYYCNYNGSKASCDSHTNGYASNRYCQNHTSLFEKYQEQSFKNIDLPFWCFQSHTQCNQYTHFSNFLKLVHCIENSGFIYNSQESF